jgi:hypothetical protein
MPLLKKVVVRTFSYLMLIGVGALQILMPKLAYAVANNPNPAGVVELQRLVQRIINVSTGVAFIALTVMLATAGFKFLTSGGDSKAVQSAGQTLTWALLGILFLMLAWVFLKIIENFTGVPLTHFCIGFGPGTNNDPKLNTPDRLANLNNCN